MVFCRSIATCKSTADVEWVDPLPAQTSIILELHGDLDAAARRRVFREARQSEDRSIILVATDVAARGLDIDDVGLCLQLGAPLKAGRRGVSDPDLYAHRFGRAARGGRGGRLFGLWRSTRRPARLQWPRRCLQKTISICSRRSRRRLQQRCGRRPSGVLLAPATEQMMILVAAVLGDLRPSLIMRLKRLLVAALAASGECQGPRKTVTRNGKA